MNTTFIGNPVHLGILINKREKKKKQDTHDM